MGKFRVIFENGHEEDVDAVDGLSAKRQARRKAGLFKDERQSGGTRDNVSKIVSVEPVEEPPPQPAAAPLPQQWPQPVAPPPTPAPTTEPAAAPVPPPTPVL